MSRRNVDLGSGSVGKLLFSLAVPTITSQIVNMLYNLVDRVYIGHMQPVETVGKLALTGVGVCLPIIMVISAFAALMAFGGAPRASIAEGRGDLKESERIMGNSFTMLVAVSVVLTVVFLVFAEPMLRIFGASDNTIGYALNYAHLCPGHHLRPGDPGHERLYHRPGFRQNGDVLRADRRGGQHCFGPHLHLWLLR